MKGILVFVISIHFLILQLSLKASTSLDFQTIDRLTYHCFNEQKWDSVILVGKQALRQNIDYFYLRARMGISYFNLNQYIPSVNHLKKAREFNSHDLTVNEYLYRAYIYTNHPEEAAILISSLPDEAVKSEKYHPGFLEQINVESGYTLSSDRTPGNLSTLMEKDSIYGEEDLYGNSIYENLNIKLKVSNRISLTLAYNYLNFNKTKYIQYGRSEAHLDTIIENQFSRDYFYSYSWKIHDTSFRYHISQNEAYIAASIALPGGFKIIPAFHWINVRYPIVDVRYSADSIDDTAYYSYIDSTYHLFRYSSLGYSFTPHDTSFNNFVAGIRISKDFGRVNLALSGSWSNLNGKTQKQAGLTFTYYPLGNLDFYGSTTITGFFQKKDKRLLLSQIIGAKIASWCWAEGSFYYGDLTNANIYNGYIVYNNSDKIDYRAGINFIFPLGNHIRISLIYQYFRKESQQLYYVKTQVSGTNEIKETQQIKNNPYSTNSIIGGITWKL